VPIDLSRLEDGTKPKQIRMTQNAGKLPPLNGRGEKETKKKKKKKKYPFPSKKKGKGVVEKAKRYNYTKRRVFGGPGLQTRRKLR